MADDFGYIQLYQRARLRAWPGLFVSDWSSGIWGHAQRELRPIIALSYMGDAVIWQANPVVTWYNFWAAQADAPD